jgi:hypothetical protein
VAAANPDGRFIPPNAGTGVYGWSGVIRGAAVVFFAYIGFDAVSTAAQEAKAPKRDMPIGILGSLVICAFLYVAVGFVLTGIVPFDRLNVPDPISVGIAAAGIGWFSPLIKLGIVLGLTSVILVSLLGQPRIFRAMAHDGLLPPAAAKVHPRSTPPMCRPSAAARWSRCSRECCRSGSSANSSASERCLRLRSFRLARSHCASPIPAWSAHSERRRFGSSRPWGRDLGLFDVRTAA